MRFAIAGTCLSSQGEAKPKGMPHNLFKDQIKRPQSHSN